MRLAPHQLATHLQKETAPLYVLYGPEAFLADESAQLIRQRCLADPACERLAFQCDGASTPWEAITQALQSPSLFATHQLIELKIHKLLPTDPAKLLTCFALMAPHHTCLIQCSPALKSVHKAKWLQTLESRGVSIAHFPLSTSQLQHWIMARAKALGLILRTEVIALLLYRTEGNCLAAAQEIERLALCHAASSDADPTPITVADMGLHHQFDVFELTDAILYRQPDRVIQIISSLKEGQGVALSLVLWVLAQTLRVFIQAPSIPSPEQKTRLLFQLGIRKQSHALYTKAMHRANTAACQALCARLSQIDHQLKSGRLLNAWSETLTVCLTMTHDCLD